ncbi:MAG: hypothetical protein K8F54_13180 [Altibacter sp.]|uniref:hypothetical protein n=1 Tax=Altibacter sp. TaxID=2024823 RepID=UPI001D324BA7|nr:hypothetical protein [Altibacter sp.]MBZ0328555.1 hypothetical protein [Altibacter sp.]
MQTKLLRMVFEKALHEGASNSRNGIATHISQALDHDFKFSITSKAISNYHQKLEEGETFTISKVIRNQLSKYLGYTDYKDFIKKNEEITVKKNRSRYVIILLLVIIGYFIYDSTRKKCMQWQGDRYVKVHCEEPNTIPLDIGLYNNFRKLEATCEKTFFFNADGSPKVWYYKRGDKDLELFSAPGVHPLKGNDLRKINVDMIKKHVCPDYSE